VPPLEADPRRVLAFSDHWVIQADGVVSVEKTEINTRRYGRFGLKEGELADPAGFVLIKNGLPLAMASLFRKDALDAGLLVAEVSGAYDLWISCLLVASGRPLYYVPERLTRYRVHPGMESGRPGADRNQNHVYIFSEIIRRDLFPALRSHLRARLGGALFHLGRDKLYFNDLPGSRLCFKKALSTHRDWRPLAAYVLSWLPLRCRVWLKLSKPGDGSWTIV
jgi:hypothetical protein